MAGPSARRWTASRRCPSSAYRSAGLVGLARFRIGFAHQYRPLAGDELTFVLTRHWKRLGLNLDPGDFTDHQNKERIARMEAAGQMTPAGRRLVDAAQANGAWTALDDVENLVVPAARRGPLLVADVLGDPAVLLVEAETLVGLTLRGHPDQARGPDGAAVV